VVIIIPQNNTTLITHGSDTTQQLITGRYDPLSNTLRITLGSEIEKFLLFLFIGKKKKRNFSNPSPSHRVMG
jgi:hypothetical protein